MDETTDTLAALLADHGDRWTITRAPQITGTWWAISHPTPTSEHLIASHSLTELRELIEAAA